MLSKKMRNNVNAQKQKNIVKGFQEFGDEYVWTKAGIVQFRLGDNVYDCRTYPFDKAIQKTVNADPKRKSAGLAMHVKDIYKWTNNPCRHVLTGRVSAHKVCTKNYECYHCAYDQMLDEEDMDFMGTKPA